MGKQISVQKFNNKKHYKRKVKGNKKLRKQHLLDRDNPFNDLYFWSREVRIKDGHKCLICGKTRRLSTHHLFSKSKFPKLKYNISNGLTLCVQCHDEVHKLN